MTSSDWREEFDKAWIEKRNWFITNVARLFQKYFGKQAEPCPDCGGSLWTVCEKNMREMYAQAMDKAHEYDVSFIEKTRKDAVVEAFERTMLNGVSIAEIIRKHKELPTNK